MLYRFGIEALIIGVPRLKECTPDSALLSQDHWPLPLIFLIHPAPKWPP